jgi:hypothetical protein
MFKKEVFHFHPHLGSDDGNEDQQVKKLIESLKIVRIMYKHDDCVLFLLFSVSALVVLNACFILFYCIL